MEKSRVEFPDKFQFLFQPARYKVSYGGRGGAKSWAFARALLVLAAQSPLRILCAREFQNSIRESVHKLISDQVDSLGFSDLFEVLQASIRGHNGSEFVFAGLKTNPRAIKSMEGIDICWVEEAQSVSNESWEILIPTIRAPGSEIWVSFNPHMESDPTYRRFVVSPPPEAVVVKVSWRDNPWFPAELSMEKDYLARVDKDAYVHVWEGGCQTRSDAQVLGGKCIVQEFDPGKTWDGPYFGADWGFSSDPATLVKLWVHERRLYVHEEFWGIGVEIDALPSWFEKIEGSRSHVIRGDNARPETISFLQRHGYPRIIAADKWTGSVEDGVAFLRSFEQIVIHPRCRHFEEESRLYQYKTDRLTGDILPDIEDKNNHCIDATRYALQPMIKNSGLGMLDFMAAQAEKKKLAEEKLKALVGR